MSDLTAIEKRKLERALGMESGYVLNFSNRTFIEFFLDSFAIDIYDAMRPFLEIRITTYRARSVCLAEYDGP
jgi:hypothetical protein